MLKMKCLPVVLAMMMVLSTGIVGAFASEKESVEPSNLCVENEQVSMSSEIQLPSDIQFGGAQGVDAESLEADSPLELSEKTDQLPAVKSFTLNSLTEATAVANQAPVAELKYVIMNPESLVNGKVTTNTQIAWLWSYDGTNYTYDPDGDEITNRNINGINQSDILGMLNGGIGFVTKFSTAAEYRMQFQVTDSKGAKSNIYSIAIAVEPADGNTRPVCSLSYTSAVQALSPVSINWQKSSDADSGDSITDFRGIVYKNGVERDLKDYIVSGTLTSTSANLMLPEVGTYEIWASVKDSHNAWSNWAIFKVEVQRVVHNDPDFVYISQQEDRVLFRPSVGYLGKTTFNGEDAFYISSNAKIYGSIAKNTPTGGVDKTIAGFQSDNCKVKPVFGSGTVSKVKYLTEPNSMFPSWWSYLQFNGKPGDIYYLDCYYYSPAEGRVNEVYISAHCYFIVK